MQTQFTVEEMNLMCIFPRATKSILVNAIQAIQPLSNDAELTALISSTLLKLNRVPEDEFRKIHLLPPDEADATA
ncbi:MAG TPA: transposon-transfer assisting family protein [Clostridia bacterium]|nr:transposon-transfer assisting family protein [Clostridia bacterium]